MEDFATVSNTSMVPGQSVPDAPTGEPLGQETFLRLLTEQMQHQDPMDPMKNEDFVAQLAQFSSLEQLMGLQGVMEGVYVGIMSMNNASMASLVGTEVVASGNQVRIEDGVGVDLHFDSPTDLEGGSITIKDENGVVVRTMDIGAQESGEFTVAWDGTDDDGQAVDDGLYTFEIEATDSDGEADVATRIVGTVTEMDYSTGTPQPSIEGVVVGIDAILKLTADDGAEAADPVATP